MVGRGVIIHRVDSPWNGKFGRVARVDPKLPFPVLVSLIGLTTDLVPFLPFELEPSALA